MLELQAVDVSIGSVSVLRKASLAVAAGSFAGLIGRNGAGKTTLMRSVMGILPCRSGSIRFDGEPLDRVPTHRRAALGIGYMPEDRRMIPTLTVEENLLLPAWATRADDSAERLAFVYRLIPEAQAFASRRGLQLSGGQQKLAALARALMCGRRLLLLDEPFEGVAPVLCKRLVEVIAGLKDAGVAVMLTESDLSYARALLDVVYTIDRGEVKRAG